MRVLLLVIVILICILAKTENYGENQVNSSQMPTIINIGNDINISNWITSTNSGLAAGKGLVSTGKDAQLAPSGDFKLQLGELNRKCWVDDTGKCAGFRKQLQNGGGGPVWYLYTTSGKFPSTTLNQSQTYSTKVLTVKDTYIIPDFIVVAKSTQAPIGGLCSWYKKTHTCTTPCGVPGTFQDTYVVSNYVEGKCFGSEGQPLDWGNGEKAITGAPCSPPVCANTQYLRSIPGNVTTPTTPSPGWNFGTTSIKACQEACTNKIGCNIIQWTTGGCTGYTTITGVTPNSAAFVYFK